MTQAFRQAKIPGRLETIDCAEYPCIVYGRIFGDEDYLERLERARSLAAYEHDILTLLSWAATDESVRDRKPHGEGQPERLLFAMAVYPREHRQSFGENLDRRIRVRTADLWNAIRPDDDE